MALDSKIPAARPSEVLDSWKAIASYLNREVRTAMRWKRTRGLPVHKLPGGGKPGVYALKSELETWRKSGRTSLEGAGEGVRPSLSSAPSVAVLPFVNLSAEKDTEYFGDGLADEIINTLTRIQGLSVTARTSSFGFRGKEQDVCEIGARLRVAALLEGSVQRAQNRVRISAQLVSCTDGYHLWSERYDRDLTDIFAVQEQIAGSIAAALQLKLVAQAPRQRAANLEAFNLCLKGRHHRFSRRSLDNLHKAGECFSQAVALDPNYAAAHLGLAYHHRDLAVMGILSPRQAIERGRAAAERALALDDTLGEAHAMLGFFRALDFDWPGAAHAFADARARDPGSPQVLSNYVTSVLVPAMRLDQAEAEAARSLELDPLSAESHFQMALVFIFQRRYDRAEAIIRTGSELMVGDPGADWLSGIIAAMQGRFEEAIARCEGAVRRFGYNPMLAAALGMLQGWAGRREEARRILDTLEQAARAGYVSPIYRAWVHIGLGETDSAFAWLDRAVDEHGPHVFHLPAKPVYDGIRQDPRFAALLRKMRLENRPS